MLTLGLEMVTRLARLYMMLRVMNCVFALALNTLYH